MASLGKKLRIILLTCFYPIMLFANAPPASMTGLTSIISSSKIQQFFLNCINELKVEVWQMGNLFNELQLQQRSLCYKNGYRV